MVSSGISDVAFASVYSEKTSMIGENQYEEVLDNDNYCYEKIARNYGFWRALEIDFHYERKARKVMVDFKFDALYN